MYEIWTSRIINIHNGSYSIHSVQSVQKIYTHALHAHVMSSGDPECGFHFEDVKILETGRYDEQIRFIESILLKYDKQNLNTCERSIKLEIV